MPENLRTHASSGARLRTRHLRAIAFTGLVAAGGVVVACAAEPRQDFVAVADVQEVMVSVMEPAAEVYWDAVGEILTADGVQELRPSSDEEWEAVRDAAFVIAESGNLLMMDGRLRDRGEWISLSRAMVDTGEEALRAAEARDPDAVFDAGAEVYYACSNCHARYAEETLRPNDLRADSVAETGAPSDEGAGTAPDAAQDPAAEVRSGAAPDG